MGVSISLPILMALQQAEPEPASISISQALLLGIAVVLLFLVSIMATGWMAKKTLDTDEVFKEAVWATVLKNVSFAIGGGLLTGYLGVSPGFSLFVVAVVAPIVIYKLLYSSTIMQAVIIWIGVLVTEIVVGGSLILGAYSIGDWLDTKYNLPVGFLDPRHLVSMLGAPS